jgi:zinc transport system substrate-binding protein
VHHHRAVLEPTPRRPPAGGAAGRVRSGSRPRAAVVAVALASALLAAGCGGGGGTSTPSAPVLTVVTGLWPLAQAATAIGQRDVKVVDVVPDGHDPGPYHLATAAAAEVRAAPVVLEIGGGFQPSFEAAAATNPHTVKLLPSPGASPYVWLNPYGMEHVATTIAAAMTAADPAAKGTFSGGLADLQASLAALDDDYQSTLSVCPDQKLVTVTGAFAGLHPRYPVTDVAIARGPLTPVPTQAEVAADVAAIRASGAKEIYDESWIPQSDIVEATAIAEVKVGTIDTLAGPPAAGYPQGSSRALPYIGEMEQVLSTLSSALHCPNPDDS